MSIAIRATVTVALISAGGFATVSNPEIRRTLRTVRTTTPRPVGKEQCNHSLAATSGTTGLVSKAADHSVWGAFFDAGARLRLPVQPGPCFCEINVAIPLVMTDWTVERTGRDSLRTFALTSAAVCMENIWKMEFPNAFVRCCGRSWSGRSAVSC